MSVAEMKKTILEKVETLSEQQLTDVNQFLDKINKMPGKEYNLLQHVEKIISERSDVLKKLAQ